MFNVSQLYSIPQNKTIFLEVNYNDRAFSTMKKKKRDLRFFDHNPTITFPAGHYIKNTNIVNKKLANRLFSLQYENFIFWLKYRQQKVDLKTTQKLLVFVTIQHRKFHLYVQLSCMKIKYIYARKTHLRKDAAFSHFRLKVSSENMIFP